MAAAGLGDRATKSADCATQSADKVTKPFGSLLGYDDERFSDRRLTVYIPSSKIAIPLALDVEAKTAESSVLSLHVNSLLLARSSAFFATLFTTGMREAQEKEVAISLADQNEAELFQRLIRWIYDQVTPKIPEYDLFHLARLADKFRVNELTKRCARAMTRPTRAWSTSLVCRVLSFGEAVSFGCAPPASKAAAKKAAAKRGAREDKERGNSDELVCHGLGQLLRHATRILVNRFGDMEENATFMMPEFLNLPAHALQVLLASDDLVVASENTVFQALRQWIMHKRLLLDTAHVLELPLLIQQLRLFHCTANFFTDVVRPHLIGVGAWCESAAVKEQVMAAASLLLLPAERRVGTKMPKVARRKWSSSVSCVWSAKLSDLNERPPTVETKKHSKTAELKAISLPLSLTDHPDVQPLHYWNRCERTQACSPWIWLNGYAWLVALVRLATGDLAFQLFVDVLRTGANDQLWLTARWGLAVTHRQPPLPRVLCEQEFRASSFSKRSQSFQPVTFNEDGVAVVTVSISSEG